MIKRNLKGGDVKDGILLHKKLFETLLRHKVTYLQNQCPDESEDAFLLLFLINYKQSEHIKLLIQ